ncbi:hypothetical protein PENTCL1PPCAC_2941, partial [Pristionchus entomophagus]
LFQTVSAFSLRSLLQPISYVFTDPAVNINLNISDAPSPFDVSTCGRGKGCYLPNDCVPGANWLVCSLAFSFRPISAQSIEMELFATIDKDIKSDNFYVAVGFSDDAKMGDEPTTECSLLSSEKTPTVKASYNYFIFDENKRGVSNRRIEGEEGMRSRLFSSPEITTIDGMVYCKFIQNIGGLGNVPMEYLNTTVDTPFHFLLAKGDALPAGRGK